jgi:hypothetical protein
MALVTPYGTVQVCGPPDTTSSPARVENSGLWHGMQAEQRMHDLWVAAAPLLRCGSHVSYR